jgi:RNA polymerase sigma-70 factor (ECF subfamily)
MVESNPNKNKTDQELVELTLQNQENFLYLIQRYEKKLLYYILKISNVSLEEAEDILQDTLIKVYTNLNNYDPNLKFSSWIYRITHNQVISNYRKNKSRPQIISINLENGSLKNLASDLNLDSHLDLHYLKEGLKGLLDRLDIKYREVIVLKYLEEKSYDEISDIIKKPKGTVATLLNRAKKKLLEEISKNSIKLK